MGLDCIHAWHCTCNNSFKRIAMWCTKNRQVCARTHRLGCELLPDAFTLSCLDLLRNRAKHTCTLTRYYFLQSFVKTMSRQNMHNAYEYTWRCTCTAVYSYTYLQCTQKLWLNRKWMSYHSITNNMFYVQSPAAHYVTFIWGSNIMTFGRSKSLSSACSFSPESVCTRGSSAGFCHIVVFPSVLS